MYMFLSCTLERLVPFHHGMRSTRARVRPSPPKISNDHVAEIV